MTIQEYIDKVAEQLELPEKVIQRIRKDLENELYEFVQGGADQAGAIEKMGPVERTAAKLNEKYADTRGKEPLKKGEMPLLLPWCLIFSSALLLVKGAQVLFWQGTGFDAALAVLGLALTAVSALAVLRYKKK